MRRCLILAPLVLAGCPPGEDDTATTTATTPPANFSACHAADGHGYEIASADTVASPVRLDGSTLVVDVGYSGGCETHVFALCWPDQAFRESDPVQAGLEVWHGGPPDSCEAYFFEELRFDLAPLHDAWQMQYGADGGTIILDVEGAPTTVEYTFDA